MYREAYNIKCFEQDARNTRGGREDTPASSSNSPLIRIIQPNELWKKKMWNDRSQRLAFKGAFRLFLTEGKFEALEEIPGRTNAFGTPYVMIDLGDGHPPIRYLHYSIE